MDVDERRALEILGKKYNPEILSASKEPKSAQELSEELDIPQATCYRRIDELEEAGLLVLEKHTLSEEGRRKKVYRSLLESLTVRLESDGPEIVIEEKMEKKDKLADVWGDLKG